MSKLRKSISRIRLTLLYLAFKPLLPFDSSHYRERNRLRGAASRFPLLHYLLFSTRTQRENAYPLFDFRHFRVQIAKRGIGAEGDLLRIYLHDTRCNCPAPAID